VITRSERLVKHQVNVAEIGAPEQLEEVEELHVHDCLELRCEVSLDGYRIRTRRRVAGPRPKLPPHTKVDARTIRLKG
jgi:hypothetical protein